MRLRFSSSDSIPHEVPQVLINREPLPHLNFDVELLGDCDGIINELCHRLGGDFEQLCFNISRLSEITEKPPRLPEPTPSAALISSSDAAAQEEPAQPRTDSINKPAEETRGLNVTETAEENITPLEPSSNPHCPPEDTAASPKLPKGDVSKDNSADVKSQNTSLDYCKRYWMSRVNRSPISKRLEGKC